jgi:uncharacterized protein with HEPN domain
MSPPDPERIRHMVEYIEAAMQFTQGRTRADLDTDAMLMFALLRAIEVVGEAARNVSEAMRATMPGIPWRDIVGMRNRVVHAYFDVDRDILWTTATEALPALLAQLKPSRTPE